MLEIRHANQRGRAEHGWLSSRHTFSFANYYDPKQIGFCDLLVINDDRVAPGRGFGKHPHGVSALRMRYDGRIRVFFADFVYAAGRELDVHVTGALP